MSPASRADGARRASGAAMVLVALAFLLVAVGAARLGVGGGPVAPAARLVDLNGATPAELELLPGIGPALAARIVAEREARGAFRSVEDLTRVRGVGERTVRRLREVATVGE